MTALVTWGGDAMPDGVSIGRPAESSYYLTAQRARALTDEIRADLGNAILKLAVAREGHAHEALGYDHWHEYLLAEFGDLKELRLPVAERRAIVASMCDAGRSVSEVQAAIGFSRGTIQNDREALGYAAPKRGDVVSIRDEEPAPDPFAGMTRTAEALARVRAQGDRGLTSTELDHETGWPMGTATATLSRLERRRLVRRLPVFRDRRAAYVADGEE